MSSSISQPYFPNYISESYTNNGESIGYYLPPNADELFVRVETKPLARAAFALLYPSKTTAYSKYESDEYQENRGLELSIGVKAFY